MPRPWITQGPVTCRQCLSDAVIGLVKFRGGRVEQFKYDGYPSGWVIENQVTHEKAPAKLNYYILRVRAVRGGGVVDFEYQENELPEKEFNRDEKLDELFDCFVEWLDKVMPAKKPGLWAKIKGFFARKQS